MRGSHREQAERVKHSLNMKQGEGEETGRRRLLQPLSDTGREGAGLPAQISASPK